MTEAPQPISSVRYIARLYAIVPDGDMYYLFRDAGRTFVMSGTAEEIVAELGRAYREEEIRHHEIKAKQEARRLENQLNLPDIDLSGLPEIKL